MRQTLIGIVAVTLLFGGQPIAAQPAHSGNPILPGWYADPEAHVFEGQYWIYPTYSAPYGEQTFLDAFSSNDLVTWTRHPHVLDTADVRWAHRAVWAPSIVQKDGWYYLFFGANDIQNDRQQGGIGVARSRSPAGPFKDWLGKPLVDAFHNGAQPIDQMVFRDVDGTYYIAYGGWGHCNIAKLNADFTGLVPFPDGTTFKEITPKGYVEGVFMLVKDGKYYLMWSEGGWTGPDYAVAYAVGTSPFGPFERVGKILQQDPTVATGAGHHSVLHADGSPNWYIVYHRRPLGETDRNHRVVSIDTLRFDAQGFIQPVVITKSGVAADPLPPVPAQNPPDWTEPFPPFRIAGNLYYVGSKGLASYLIATPEGHVLINSDLEANVPMITASVESLGFRFEDVKVLLISHAHWDHDAGSALVKRMTGASYMVMDADVPVVESGGARDFHYGDRTDLRYPAVKVDRVLHDGDEVRLGGAVLTAHLTPGHTKGTTTWTMRVNDDGKMRDVVIVGSPNVNPGYRLVGNAAYPQIAEDFERSFEILRSLPCDYFLGAHGGYFGLDAKYERARRGDATAFIDPAGYRSYVAEREQAFRTELARQRATSPGGSSPDD